MEIKVNTKFNIGQEVYICYKDSYFINGEFKSVYVPDTNPKVINKIFIIQKTNTVHILYSCKDDIQQYTEDKVFETLEEAQKWCNNYE